MCSPSMPTPPDPYETAGAQTATNVSTAVANNYMGFVDQIGPNGNITYRQRRNNDGELVNRTITDPNTGDTYTIPMFEQRTELSPQAALVQDNNLRAQRALSGTAADQAQFLRRYMDDRLTQRDLPGRGQMPDQVQFQNLNLNEQGIQLPNVMTRQADGGDITRTYGGADDYSADRQRVEDALMQRLNPSLEGDRQALRSQLANQGINEGSQAWMTAMDDLSRRGNDARLGAILSAGQEQSRLDEMAARAAGFGNAAQQQAFGQDRTNIDSYNAAQSQIVGQRFANREYENAAQQANLQSANANAAAQYGMGMDAYNAQNAARAAQMQEDFAYRNQPLNEVSALLGQTQVQSPQMNAISTAQMPTTDIAGLINTNYQQRAANAQAQSGFLGNLIGAGANVFSGGLAGGLFG